MTSSRPMLILTAAVTSVVLAVGGCSSQPPRQHAADLVKKGLAAHSLGHLDEAKADYEKALKADPNNVFALYNLGLIAQTQGDKTTAERDYRAALAINPKFGAALFNLGVLLQGESNYAASADLYRQVLAINFTDASAHLNLGFALESLGEKREAQKEFATAIQLNPSLRSRIPSKDLAPSPAASPTPTHS